VCAADGVVRDDGFGVTAAAQVGCGWVAAAAAAAAAPLVEFGGAA
jgi:hypothetical protein